MQAIKSFFSSEDNLVMKKITSKAQLKEALEKCVYRFPSEAERDIIETTTTYRNIYPCIDVYVSNDGLEHKLVCLDGTIPVNYKGTMYQIPICIWLSQQHPNLPPLVQVKPTNNMSIKVGNNVDDAGMVSIPYLDEWQKVKSDLVSLVQVLCVVFGENTPVYSNFPKSTTCTFHKGDSSALLSGATPKPVDKSSKGHVEVHPIESDRSEINRDENKKKRAMLLLDVDRVLTSAQIIYGQAKDMISVLENSKSDLIKGSLSESDLQKLNDDKETTSDWLVELEKDFKNTSARSNEIMNEVKDMKIASQMHVSSQDSQKSYQNWSNHDVCRWFQLIGMGEFVESVRQHGIRGVHLPNLSKEDLIELGVVRLGQRMTIDAEINKLCNSAMNIV